MKCNNCGNEFEGNFCDKCGTKATAPEPNKKFEKAKALLIDPKEEVKSVLCNKFMQTFISTGMLGNGFAILTDKRVYFKGKCYFRKGKTFYSKTEEKTVDLKDVTGTGYIHNSTKWARIIGLILTIYAASCTGLMLLITIFNLLLGEMNFDGMEKSIYFLILPGIIGLILLWFHKKTTYSVFEISYAGGGIAFDMNWITQQESKEFQQQLVLLKQIEKETTTPFIPIKADNQSSIPQQLMEYKELLDSGIITQEEFDTKKKELLTK